jgi:hypothetical protein
VSRKSLLRAVVAVGLSAVVGVIILGVQILPDTPSVAPAAVFASESCPANDLACGTVTATLSVIHRFRTTLGYEDVEPLTTTLVAITPKYYTKAGLSGCPCDQALPSLVFDLEWDGSIWTATNCVSNGLLNNNVDSPDCTAFVAPFTGLALSTIAECDGSPDDHSAKVAIAVGMSATTSGICDIAASPDTQKTYNAVSADFMLTNFSEGRQINSNCTLASTPLRPTRGAYNKVIPVSCTNAAGHAATQYVNYND